MFFNRNYFYIMIFIIYVIFFMNCSNQPNINIAEEKLQKYENIQSLILYSYDPFGPITKFVRIELFNNKINVLENLHDTSQVQDICMCLSIVHSSEIHTTTSVFSDGTEASYQLILHVYMQLIIPNKKICHSFNIRVYRSFIKNFNNILFNNVQEHDMRNSMYQEVAKKLIIYINKQI